MKANQTTTHDDDWELVDLTYSKYRPLPATVSEDGRGMLLAAVTVLDKALVEAPANVVKKALARLMISTTKRAEDRDDMEFRLAVYSEAMKFPADVVLEVFQRWENGEIKGGPKRAKWFPAVPELRELCDNLVRWRRVTRDTLARMAE